MSEASDYATALTIDEVPAARLLRIRTSAVDRRDHAMKGAARQQDRADLRNDWPAACQSLASLLSSLSRADCRQIADIVRATCADILRRAAIRCGACCSWHRFAGRGARARGHDPTTRVRANAAGHTGRGAICSAPPGVGRGRDIRASRRRLLLLRRRRCHCSSVERSPVPSPRVY